MRTELTLRYLLLRHLKRLEPVAPPLRFREVTTSLAVGIERSDYVVTWRTSGELQSRTLPRSAFAFYARGDVPGTADGDIDPGAQNDARAQAFAEAVLGVAAPTRASEPFIPHPWSAALGAVVFAVGLATAGGLGFPTGATLLALGLAELVPRARLVAAVAVVLVAGVGPPIAGGLLALGYGVLQGIASDPTWRGVRLGLCAAAVVVSGARSIAAGSEFRLDWIAPVLAIAALWISTIRSLHADHFRSLPVVLPLYALGLWIDDQRRASLLAVAMLAIAALVATQRHRVLRVQRERNLTPNG